MSRIKRPTTMKIHGLHKHIDNGGISVEVHCDEDGYLSLIMDASYFGYPSVKSGLYLKGVISNNQEFLQELGTMLIEAAAKIPSLPPTESK